MTRAVCHANRVERVGQDRRRPLGFGIAWATAGYLDAEDRFWFCGRVAHRVLTPEGPHVSGLLRGDFQPASGHPPQRVGRHWADRVATSGDHSGAAQGSHARRTQQRRSCWTRSPRLRAANPLTSAHFRLPLASEFSGRYSPQREDLPREAGRLGGGQHCSDSAAGGILGCGRVVCWISWQGWDGGTHVEIRRRHLPGRPGRTARISARRHNRTRDVTFVPAPARWSIWPLVA